MTDTKTTPPESIKLTLRYGAEVEVELCYWASIGPKRVYHLTQDFALVELLPGSEEKGHGWPGFGYYENGVMVTHGEDTSLQDALNRACRNTGEQETIDRVAHLAEYYLPTLEGMARVLKAEGHDVSVDRDGLHVHMCAQEEKEKIAPVVTISHSTSGGLVLLSEVSYLGRDVSSHEILDAARKDLEAIKREREANKAPEAVAAAALAQLRDDGIRARLEEPTTIKATALNDESIEVSHGIRGDGSAGWRVTAGSGYWVDEADIVATIKSELRRMERCVDRRIRLCNCGDSYDDTRPDGSPGFCLACADSMANIPREQAGRVMQILKASDPSSSTILDKSLQELLWNVEEWKLDVDRGLRETRQSYGDPVSWEPAPPSYPGTSLSLNLEICGIPNQQSGEIQRALHAGAINAGFKIGKKPTRRGKHEGDGEGELTDNDAVRLLSGEPQRVESMSRAQVSRFNGYVASGLVTAPGTIWEPLRYKATAKGIQAAADYAKEHWCGE